MAQICIHAFITGRVQGVWFRQSTKEQAEQHGLTGWVRNLPDGRVEALLQGDERGVRQVEAWLNQGPPLATVAEVQSELVDQMEEVDGFEVR
ncbi:acylphosphatase [Marinobacterium arenosum]|uniref:acylphosphatase n=1 Tax=Marinobacterium arenosum TaxID=2862496 RepID=UPI001C972C29|nr:acylphosphatase [Marinobacterium arenosum]MBY4677103.1 acylphosphatase [Marinobacterium arenosum]